MAAIITRVFVRGVDSLLLVPNALNIFSQFLNRICVFYDVLCSNGVLYPTSTRLPEQHLPPNSADFLSRYQPVQLHGICIVHVERSETHVIRCREQVTSGRKWRIDSRQYSLFGREVKSVGA